MSLCLFVFVTFCLCVLDREGAKFIHGLFLSPPKSVPLSVNPVQVSYEFCTPLPFLISLCCSLPTFQLSERQIPFFFYSQALSRIFRVFLFAHFLYFRHSGQIHKGRNPPKRCEKALEGSKGALFQKTSKNGPLPGFNERISREILKINL